MPVATGQSQRRNRYFAVWCESCFLFMFSCYFVFPVKSAYHMDDQDHILQDSEPPGSAEGSISPAQAAHKGDTEAALHHHYSCAVLLARLSETVNASGDLAAICQMFAEEVGDLFEADAASVFLATGPRYLNYTAGSGLSQRFIAHVEETASAEASSQFLSRLQGPTIIRDIRQEQIAPPYGRLLLDEGITALASFPMRNRGKLLGFTTLYYKKARDFSEADISEADINVLRSFTNLLALSVANVQFTEAKQGENKARDRFLNALSHELRTPLTSILGFTQVIRKRFINAPGTDARLLDQLEVLWTQAQRLNRLIDTFVDLSHIERGEFEINLGKVELGTVLGSAVAQALGQARSKQRVEVQITDPTIWVLGDRRRLEQVFTHIVSNALRYSPPDEPIVVRCRVDATQGHVVVDVSDSGPGIPVHLRKDIFERLNPGDAQRSGGLGVGLYLSRTVIEAHGGHISVQSSPSEGTTITIVLPV